MKLHLPKRLFTALLTAITLAAAPAALTLGSAAWGAEVAIAAETLTWNSETDFTAYSGNLLSLKNGSTITMSGGELTVSQLRLHDINTSTRETFTLTGGTLSASYADNGDKSGSGEAAIVLGHWGNGSGGVLNVSGTQNGDGTWTNGTLNVLNGTIRMGWDSDSVLDITEGGVVNAKGIRLNVNKGKTNLTHTLNLNGGRLNVGTLGISTPSTYSPNYQVKLLNGTLGTLNKEGWVLSNLNTTIGNITIDTDVWDAAAKATATGDAAGSANISLLGDLTAESETSSITLDGSGSLTIDHTWDGTLNLADGATTKVYLSDVDNFDIVGYIDATRTVSTSGFADKVRVSDSGSKFYDNKVYIGETAYTVTDGVAEGVHTATSIFYVNEDLEYNSATMAGASGFSVSANNKLTFNRGTIEYKYNSLQGSGTTAIQNQGKVRVTSPLNYEGLIEIDGDGSELRLSGSGGSTISSLLLKNGGTLKFLANDGAYTHTLTNVEVNESGTIFVSSDNTGKYYEACVDIANLTNSVDEEGNVIEGTVTLKSEYRNSKRNVFNLNGGDFHGTINFYSGSSSTSGATRKHALNINSSTAAKNAVINISNSLNSGVTMALGIGAPKVTVKGITGGTSNTGIYSGSQAFNSSDALASDDTRRTLIVDTPADDAVLGGYSTVATVGSNLNLIKKGEGSQAFTGNMSAFNGIIDVQEGTLTIGAADGSTATKLGLGGTISNAGTLNLYTNATADKANIFEVKTVTGVTDAGFATADVTYYLVSGTGTVNLKDNATITIGETEYALTKTGNVVTFSTADADTYYVLTEATTSSALAAASAAGKTLEDINIAESGTLTYDSGPLKNVVLNGSGTYKLESGTTALTSGVKLGSGWTGVVLINGTGSGTNFETLNNELGAQTTLGFEAAAGYLWSSGGSTGKFTADVFLRNGEGDNNYAMKLDNGTSSGHADVEFTGKIMGDGDIWYTFANGSPHNAIHTFSGDLSEWNGEFIENANAKTVIAKFTSGGNVFLKNGTGGVKDADSSGHLYVTIDAADGSTTTFNGIIENAARVDVNSDTIFAANWTGVGTANVADGIHMTVQGGLSNQTISIGTLSAASADVTLGNYATLSLGGGTTEAQKTHSIGTLSMGAGASVSLGENATLQLVNTLPFFHGNWNDGNRDQEASLDLTIQGAAGSMLSLALNTDTSWNTNDTIKLRPHTADGGTVESVYIREGALANAVYHNGAVTDLGGANLTMADDTKLVLRKALAENTNFGAGTITLEGATGMVLYGSNAYTISNRIEGVNGILNITGDSASSITFTNVLQLNTLTSNKNVTLGGGTEQNPLEHTISNLTVTGGTLTLAEHAVLNANTFANGVTLSGSGTLNFGTAENVRTLSNNHMYINGTNSNNQFFNASKSDWTGTVVINGARYGENDKNLCLNLNLLGNAGSKVELINTAGWFSSNNDLATSLILSQDKNNAELAAWTITNGSSDAGANGTRIMATFAGAVSGAGTMKFGWSQDNEATTGFKFTGDVSGWTGWFDMAATDNKNYFNLRFEGNANNIAVNVKETSGHVHVRIDDEGAQANGTPINVGGQIDASYMTLGKSEDTASDRATVKLNNTVDLSATLTNYANTTVATGKTLTAGTVSNSGKIKLGEAATVTGGTMSKVQMSSAGITGKQDGSSRMSNADIEVLAQNATFTIADMTLTNTSITAATVNIVNSKVSGNVVLNVVKPAEAITAPNVGTGGSGEISFTYGLALVDSSSTLTLNMEVPQAILPSASGLYNLTITLNGFAADFDFSNIANQVVFGADSWLGQALKGATPVVTVDDPTLGDGAAAAQSASGAPSVSYAATGGNVGSLVITITGLNVPEPTTATLSLLALAALAGRRRRK